MNNECNLIQDPTPSSNESAVGASEGTSRRSLIGSATLAGIAIVAGSGKSSAAEVEREIQGDEALNVKIMRAHLSGPASITKDASVAEVDAHGKVTILFQGTNKWMCMPGDENKVGDPPMCADPVAMQWFADVKAGKPKPTNTVPGIAYMLCGATQHSNTDPFDKTSPAIPIGPHWMILWPFDAATCGLPTTLRDKGAWMMFADTPYAYLHICGTPWEGNEYKAGDPGIWTMEYPSSARR